MLVTPCFVSSKLAEKIPVKPLLFNFLLKVNPSGIKSSIFFQSLIFVKLFRICLIPSYVVNTGNLGILIV